MYECICCKIMYDDEGKWKMVTVTKFAKEIGATMPQIYKMYICEKYDDDTVSNVNVMINRTIEFYKSHNVNVFGDTYRGGYTHIVTNGDSDCRSEDTLYDLKTSKNPPKNEHYIQLMVYYILGLHSVHKEKYEHLEKLAIYNPRLNVQYVWEIDRENERLKNIEKLMGYDLEEEA